MQTDGKINKVMPPQGENDSKADDATVVTGSKGVLHPGVPRIPDHELIRKIGSGAYGDVWLSRNVMGVYRAVKIVYRKSFREERPYEREYEGIRKFEPISRSHPSQLPMLHVGRNDEEGYFFYVMELGDPAQPVPAEENPEEREGSTTGGQARIDPESYEPRTLRHERDREGRISFDRVLDIGLGLATALGHLHRHGLIHRDIKLANIVFVNGVPKLADIGLVTESGSDATFVGTEGYMPPEGSGTKVGDIYSLGKVLYELATGKDRTAFPNFSAEGLSAAQAGKLEEIQQIILKACAINPASRYASAEDLQNDLMLLKTGQSILKLRAWKRVVDFNTRFGIFNVLRLSGASILVALLLLAQGSEWRTEAMWLYYGYWAFAAVAALLCLKSERVSRWNMISIPFIDMPLFFLMQLWALRLGVGLPVFEEPGAYAAWASGLSNFSVGVFVILIMMATLSEKEWQIALAAAVAIACETGLMIMAEQKPLDTLSAAIVLGFAATICAFAKRYVVDLAPSRA